MSEQVVTIEESKASEASALITLIKEAADETDFIIGTEDIIAATIEELECFLEASQESLTDICLLLKVGDTLAGKAYRETSYVGDCFMLVLKPYRNHGLGQLLMETALDWARETKQLCALELEVQARNTCAYHIYEKYGFKIEGVKRKDVKSRNGDYQDVYLMRKYLERE
ncbi:GNAT family N-acetyltransferase [Streptococcus equi]|uniref:GNAT family N-acetyltransferase n=1 Tax=Streptococcus equi TaxID=1336 RepID=UPI001E31D2E7|nr:GNAT family N-acetyltransferase [Streptococcus equi]MCD3461822.1 GNAT family N-acetyltransferase [Streptococcus equi subsp. zooepidemicus]HEK9980892.1 GNAT family N-acetyltransferase [Streptococcus equi subsp. zooepidemicus]HEL0766952.1 GNAT family N-acetyltransferase [Streptococcus equi subsp. zooepidemicus]HEL1131269.1 GNAT family N-acetyltransferase [Streptococcus equi subsp. zooepidemicus]